MSQFIVGLTGGIGSGKTAASDHFSTLGIAIVDADVCARVVVEKGQPALAEITKHFGDKTLNNDGSLDRAVLRQIIFNNPQEKTWLESLLHPLIFEEITRQLEQAKSPYVIFVSPLLIEGQQRHLCQRILVIDAPESAQVSRASERDDNSEEQIKAIMATQSSRSQRLEAADDVITNDGDLASLYAQVEKLHKKYCALVRS